MEKQEEIINEDKLKSVLTERQYKRLHLYAVMNMTLEQIADIEHVSIQSVSRSIHAAKKENFEISFPNRVKKCRFKRDR